MWLTNICICSMLLDKSVCTMHYANKRTWLYLKLSIIWTLVMETQTPLRRNRHKATGRMLRYKVLRSTGGEDMTTKGKVDTSDLILLKRWIRNISSRSHQLNGSVELHLRHTLDKMYISSIWLCTSYSFENGDFWQTCPIHADKTDISG